MVPAKKKKSKKKKECLRQEQNKLQQGWLSNKLVHQQVLPVSELVLCVLASKITAFNRVSESVSETASASQQVTE